MTGRNRGPRLTFKKDKDGEYVRQDKEKWEARYSAPELDYPEPDDLLVSHRDLLSGGMALDAACGQGANSIFLAEHGCEVHSIDVSRKALLQLQKRAQAKHLRISCIAADLDYYALPQNYYDIAVVFYFYSRDLIVGLSSALKPGGTIFYATFNERHTSVRPEFNPAYLASSQQFRRLFEDCFRIIYYQSLAGQAGNVVQLIARRK